jgi:hypothetical protein
MAQVIALRQKPDIQASSDPDPWRDSARIKREFYLFAADPQRAPDELFGKAIEAHVALFRQAARAATCAAGSAEVFTGSLNAFVRIWMEAPPQVELGPLGMAARRQEFKRVADALVLATAEDVRADFADRMGWHRESRSSRDDQAAAQIPDAVPPVKLRRESTSWREIMITVYNEHTVEIATPQGRRNFSYEDLQLCDRRDGTPDDRWRLLLRLAGHEGVLKRPALSLKDRDDGGWSKWKKDVQAVRKWLRERFQIEAEPIPFLEGAYRAGFGIGLRESYRQDLRGGVPVS